MCSIKNLLHKYTLPYGLCQVVSYTKVQVLKKKNPASFCQRVPLHSNWIEVRLLIGVLYATDGEKSCVRILVANTTESILFNKGEAHKQG